MNRPVVEIPLFYGDEREDVREFLGNYRRAGLLNGWDEEKLALGLPLFLKKHASVWFVTKINFSFRIRSNSMAVEAKIRRTSSVVRGDCCRLLLRYFFHSALV